MNLSSVLIACLALGVIVHGQPNPGFISIDCGAPDNYYDNSLGINYLTDASFVDSGETSQISSYFLNAYSQKQSQNLRSFPNGARNCYTLRPSQGKGNRYLIRASFWYGNYDGKNQTPIFDLHIDVNYWRTVITNVSQYQEIIYTPTRDYIQVCLVNTNLGVPFISALELRLLNNSIYQIDSGSLVLAWRYNLGSSTTYRHPQDNYDRIWSANDYNSSWPSISNTTDILTSGSNDAYDVPPQVLMSAEQVKSPSDPLFVSWPSTNSDTSELMYFHFAELDLLQNGQLREFTVYSDQFLATVTLENLKPVTVVSLPTNASNFTINATARSTLPPLLNAIEIYLIRPLPNLPTSLYDFNAINDIKKSYGVDRDTWQGDPCVPQTYAWIGLNCSYAGSSRIISLDLSSSGLTGSISNSFANLTAITSVNLSNNQLNGQLPNFLAQMPSLKILDLSGNKLTGSIPQALMKKKADGTLQLSLDGNPDLCQSNSCSEQQPSGTKTILIAIGVLLIVLSGLAAIWIIKRRKAGRGGVTNTNRMFRTHNKNRPVTSLEVARITDNFREVIGEGGFGKVYHGVLDEGTQVAVKLLSRSSKQGYKEFQAEAQLLMIVHHRNLVSLVGYCDEFENMALIYEFMSNGNVRQHLLGERGPNVLSWTERLQIAIDATQGLEYLHNGCKPPIIHRDLKTVNILLDENMRAKIADFGLSKAFVTDFDSHISTRPSGTPGYLDPEFHTSGNLSKKSDVYGFGIVLFELITGQAAIIRSQEGYVHILEWVTPLIERGDIQSVVDPRLHGSFNIGSAWKAVETAISCVPSRAIQRPDIGHVLSELKQCLASEVGSGRSQRLGNSKRGDAFEITSLELDRSTPNPR